MDIGLELNRRLEEIEAKISARLDINLHTLIDMKHTQTFARHDEAFVSLVDLVRQLSNRVVELEVVNLKLIDLTRLLRDLARLPA